MQNHENQVILYYLKKIFKDINPASVYSCVYCDSFMHEVYFQLKRICNFELDKELKQNTPEAIKAIHNFFYGSPEVSAKIHVADITDYNFDKNLSIIADAFNVPKDERPLFQFLIYLSKYDSMRHLMNDGGFSTIFPEGLLNDNQNDLQQLLDCSEWNFTHFLAQNGHMFKSNILRECGDVVTLTEEFKKLLAQDFESTEQVIEAFIGSQMTTIFNADDFEYIKSDFDNVTKLLKTSTGNKNANINILIRSPGWLSKREFVATACAATGLTAYIQNKEPSTERYVNALGKTQEILKHSTNSVVVIDDADTIFMMANKYIDERTRLKYALHTNTRPVIWLINAPKLHSDLWFDFSLVIDVQDFNEERRKRLVQNLLKKYGYEIKDNEIFHYLERVCGGTPTDILEIAVKNAKITNDDSIIKYTIDKFFAFITKKDEEK